MSAVNLAFCPMTAGIGSSPPATRPTDWRYRKWMDGCQQSLLKSLIAVGTKDLLNISVLQRSEMSLSLQLPLCPARMLWRGCLLFTKNRI